MKFPAMLWNVAFTLIWSAVAAPILCAADKPLAWPQFRGPAGSGVADRQRPPVEIGPDKNVAWKVAIPSGFSSPIAAGDLLVLTAFDEGKLYTIAYRRADGSEVWRREAPAAKIEPFHKTEGSPAAGTPATDGQRIVSYFGSCGLFCYDLAGKELWKLELPAAATMADFGSGVSPVLSDGMVVLVRDELKGSKILALDAATGRVIWEKKRQSICSYSTPVIWQTSGGTQIATAGYGKMIGYDLKSGEEKWFIQGMPSSCCTSPVVADGTLYFAGWSPGDVEDKEFQMPKFDELLKQAGEEKLGHVTKAGSEKSFLKGFFDNNDTNKDGKLTRDEWDAGLNFMAASRNSAFAVKAGGTGDVSTSHVLWKKTKGLPYVPSAILYEGQYVMVKDGGLVMAYDAKTGDELYFKRAVATGRYYASPVAADGKLYFTTLDDGTVTVLKAGAATPEVLVKNPPLGERVAATPAIADDMLFIRTEKHLYAFKSPK